MYSVRRSDMEKDVCCLKCNAVLFRVRPLDETHREIERSAELLHDGGDQYYLCPQCEAKNVVVLSKTPDCLPIYRLSHVKQ